MPQATVVLTTRNRKEELRRALRSAMMQDVPVDVLVVDDGSDDGTCEMVAGEFPEARLVRTATSLGLVIQRDQAARDVSTEYVFSLDDDAEFSAADTVRRTIAEFAHPRVGAVAIPHVDTLSEQVVNAPAPDDGQVWCVASFTGTAYAVRRDLFVQLGGFCPQFVHQGEEGDYCVRMLAAGYTVRLGRADMILHHESPRRSFDRMDFFGRRNDVLFAWRNAPWMWLAPHLSVTTINGLRCAWRTGRWKHHLRGMTNGWTLALGGQVRRNPVSVRVYKLFRALKKRGPMRLADIEPLLPAPQAVPANLSEGAEVERVAT